MERWPRLMVIVVALAPFAGCFGGDGVTPTSVEDATDGSSNLSREALPDGRGGRFVAFEETNATEAGEGGLDHPHDYWSGRERVTIFEGDVKMRSATGTTSTPGAVADLAMDSEQLVYEGTAQVELTFSNPQRRVCEPVFTSGGEYVCTDFGTGVRLPDPAGGPDGLRVDVKHAATSSWLEVGDVSWAEPVVFHVADPRQTDMPHATNTLWDFRVVSTDAAMATLTFDLKIDIVRAEGEIPLWPGHPEFYAASHERVVFGGTLVTRENGLTGLAGQSGEREIEAAVPEKLVSYGTQALYVFLNITNVEIANPVETPSGWFLEYHNASGRVASTLWTDPEHGGDVMEHVWTLKVGTDGMDSPYADGSRWGFWLRGSFDGAVVACSGCAAYEVEYDLTVVATDLEAEAYDGEA